MKKTIYLALAAISLLGTTILTGCQADMDAPENVAPEATLTPNITIADLKTAFADKTEVVGLNEDGEHYIIKGRVISSDASGNIYKSLVIQDETAALAFSVNQSNLSVMYPLGQEIVVDITGLYMGYYHELQQCGWLSDPYNGELQLGFMALDYFKNHAQLQGYPDSSYKTINYGETRPEGTMYMTVSDISTLPSSGEELRGMQSQLVEFRNVSFKGAGTQTFAAYQETVNDTIVDAQGATLIARTSGYSNFYNNTLPEGTGSVRGILSYYGGSWQLLFRDKNDVNISTKGQAEDPFSVADVLSGNYTGITGWTKGYIVGSVKAGVTTVTSNDDIEFSANAELDNNLVIAASADETNYENCVYVSLPQSSQFRVYANLLDNPDVYKKELTVQGNVGSALGMTAIVDNGGTFSTFSIPGVVEGGDATVPEAKGDGTLENPYNLGALLRMTESVDDVWVEGYIVGYVSGDDFETGAVWSAAGSDGTNIILSEEVAGRAAVANSAPVQIPTTKLAIRNVLSLYVDQNNFGKKVKIRGNIDTTKDYKNSNALRKVVEVVEE